MNDDKSYPVHRIQFQAEGKDERGLLEYGKPVEVAATWARKEGKKGELMNWHLSPDRLPKGVYTLVGNDRQPEAAKAAETNARSAHLISFCERRVDAQGKESLGPPVEVGKAEPREGLNGKRIDWNIDPKHLGEGAYFTIEVDREKSKSNTAPDQFAKVEANQKTQTADRGR